MKKITYIFYLLLFCVSLFVLTSCKKEKDVPTYTISFKFDSGETIKELTVKCGENVTIDAPTKEGHTFVGWFINNEEVTFPKSFENNTEVVAKFSVNKYTYKFIVEGATIQEGTLEYGSNIPYPSNPVKEDVNGVKYTFVKWDNPATTLTKDEVFNAVFTSEEIVYTYTFLNEDGSVISTSTGKYGDAIVYPEAPVKVSDKEYTYTFAGWDHNDETLTSDVTFRPIFEGVKINYAYTFLDASGNVFTTGTGHFGDVIAYPNSNPIKESTNTTSYKFIGWDKQDTTLTDNIVFTPVYEEEVIYYNYKFLDANGEVLKSDNVEYGATIVYPSAPTKEADKEYTYTFVGWDHSDTVITSNITFKPIFDGIKNKYTYKFVDSDGSVLFEETVEYGAMPNVPENPSKDGQKFAGWDKEVVAVTEDVIYTAVYKEGITSLEGLKVSILGDSISTFYAPGSVMNSYYTGTNEFYYPTNSATVKTVQQTWWYQLLNNNNMQLGINNSWSGSCAYGTSSSAGMTDGRIDTIDNNGNPDIVIIYLGTNDCASGYSVENFANAIETMVQKVSKFGNPDVFITTLGYSAYKGSSYSEDRRVEYNIKMREIANQYGCGIIPLDEYIDNASYSFYLGDNLHYNASGATLLSKIYEKHIKEFYGITYTGVIEVERKEPLPEGVLGKTTATANSDFWGKYSNNVFLAPSNSFTSPQYSFRIEITFDSSSNQYIVSAIHKSGVNATYNSDYVLVVSDAHENSKAVVADLEKVVVGSIVEFDTTLTFPVEVIFKESGSSSGGQTPTPTPTPTPNPDQEGKLHVGAYNTGVWTVYDTTAIIYSYDKWDLASTYINFYLMGLVKDETTGNYKITYMKDYGVASTHPVCDYYLLIYGENATKSFYLESTLDTIIVVHGDITSGNCYLEFK